MKNLFYLIIFLLTISSLNAQQYGKLRGFLTDSTSSEALAFGNVFIEELNIGASTNNRGYYIINNIPANKTYKVLFSYIGYETKELDVFIGANKITQIDVGLVTTGIELQTVEKIGEKVIERNATDLGLERISIKNLETLPKGVETDVFRSLQSIPGVQTTGDVSARYYVRGGSSNQNLVLLNGATIYNPFHALGLFSVIDPEMINTVEFYKGGFSAEYGGRLSSVMDIITKDGNKNQFSTTAASSFLTGKVMVEGPIPTGSFMITGRKSYSQDILKKFLNDQNVPIDFYDASVKLNVENPFIPNGRFHFFGFLSRDDLKNNNPFKEDFNWENNIFGFQWVQVYDSPLFTTLGLSLSQFAGEVVPNLSNAKPRKNEIKDFNMSLDFNYLFDSKDEIGLGFAFKTFNSELYTENLQGAVSDISSFGGHFSVYGKYKILRWESFGADIGTRFNVTSFTPDAQFTLEPRISLTYRPWAIFSIKGAFGVYQQEITTVTDENEVISLFEPWIVTPEYLSPSKATHYVLGFDYYLTENISFEVETYYKKIENLHAINENKSTTGDPDLVAGKGESYGYEFSTKMNVDPFRFTTGYSLSWSYKEVEGWTYYPKYDSRHNLNVSLEYNIGLGFTASAIWNYRTGLPFTELTGFYDKYFIEDFFGVWDKLGYYAPFTILGDRNLGRLPDYHRLDLSLSKSLEIGFAKFTFDVSIVNVYNRQNIFYFKRDTGEKVNMLPFMPTATIKLEI